VNCEGRAQSFNGAVRPAGEARPGWKVLRVLANLLGVPGFDYETPEQVRAEALPADVAAKLSNKVALVPAATPAAAAGGAERIADVPIYFSDPIVRRSPPLQATRAAQPPRALANARTLGAFGVAAGDKVRARQGEASALLDAALDDNLPDGVVRIAAAHASVATLGPMFGPITLERA
jgi:NADH-quinone oxidoreductase subunit G